MKVLVDSIRSETPRPKSPSMNNEEPIELSHYPAAKKPPPGEKAKIERDDFPAPPYPYTDPERRRRLSDSYKGVVSDDEDEVDKVFEDNETGLVFCFKNAFSSKKTFILFQRTVFEIFIFKCCLSLAHPTIYNITGN